MEFSISRASAVSRPLGFATVRHEPDQELVGVWLTSLASPFGAGHTNAVVLERDQQASINALLGQRIVVAAGSAEGFPEAVTIEVLRDLFSEAVLGLQSRVDAAIEEHARTTRNRNLIRPEWHGIPSVEMAASSSVELQTLAAANTVLALWRWWLDCEEQRRKRISFPSMVAAGLADPAVEPLPAQVAALFLSPAAAH